MATKHKVTAILPYYNHFPYLESRIRSVLAQTYPVNQIIFLDDASSDGSMDLAKGLLVNCRAEVSYYSNAVNSGSPFCQWNAGVVSAKHELIWIAETDDDCSPFLLESLCRKLMHFDAVLSFAQSRIVNECGENIGSGINCAHRSWSRQFAEDFVMDGDLFNSLYMSFVNAIPNASAVLFRKEAYLMAGMANQDMRYCGDWDVWVRICRQGRICFLAAHLNSHRSHPRTTRANGETVAVASEMLACRLQAFMGTASIQGPTVSLLQLLCCLCSPRRFQVLHAFRAVSFYHIIGIYHFYRTLSLVPSLGCGAWMAAGLICYLGAPVKGAKMIPGQSLRSVGSRFFSRKDQTGSMALNVCREPDPR